MSIPADKLEMIQACFELVDDVDTAESYARRYLAGEIDIGVCRFSGAGLRTLVEQRNRLAASLIEADSYTERAVIRGKLARLMADIALAEEQRAVLYIKDPE